MPRSRLSLASLAILSLPVFGEPQTYLIDERHTYPRFEYSHFGYSTQIGRFDRTSGRITLDRVARTGNIDVTIDATSIDTGNAELNEGLQGEEFFDTKKFPTIVFKSTLVKFLGDKVSSIDGNLTVKGITRPLTLRVIAFKCMPHPLVKKEACGADATASIRRSEFNAGKYAPFVSDDVNLSIAVEGIRE